MNGNTIVRDAVRTAIACGVATGFVFAGSAMAADQSQATAATAATNAAQTKLKAVEVTGTRIKRTSIEQAQPITVVTQAQIKASGLTTIGAVLQTLTSSGSSLNTQSDGGANGKAESEGQTTVNLRNLGSQRTLVLVNGHRWITDLNGTVDLNTIPSSIISHVEILQDGASAIYGSDAIAGVINIITIKNFTGAEANAYVGVYHGDGHWDGLTKNYNATVGFGNDRGNLVFSVSYNDQGGVSSANRKMSKEPIYHTGVTRGGSGDPTQGAYKFIPPYGGSTSSPSNFPAASTGLTSAQCPAAQFGTKAAPNYLPLCYLTTISGTPGTVPSDFEPFDVSDQYNYAPWAYLLTPDQRFNTYADGHYDLADNLTFSLEAATGQRHSQQQAAPAPIGISASSSVLIPANESYNPFNFSLSTTAPVGPGQLLSIGRRLFENGPRVNTEDENFVHLRSGFNGFFDMGGSEWDWDAGYMFSKDTEVDTLSGQLDSNRLAVQLSGPAACQAQAALGCVPINFFGGATRPITPAMLAYASYLDRFTYHRKGQSIYADISNSDVADLPAGPVGLAFGYQYVGNSGDFQPSAIDMQEVNPPAPTSGTTSSDAAYLEIDVPLLANLPFAKLVDLDVASRRTDAKALNVSNFNTSSKAGLKWQPTEDLLLRGSWSQGFRAPDISELFAGRTGGGYQAVDPCSGYMTSGVSESTQKLCAAQGVPQSYVQVSNQLNSQSEGNPDLKPETSISRTVGFVYSPDWLSGFNMNMDYYKIIVEGTIQGIGGQNILNGCYLQDLALDCSRIHRFTNGSGDLRVIDDSVTNIGKTQVSGIDIGGSYDFPMTAAGQFKLNLQGSYTRQYDQYLPTATGGFSVLSLAGIERGSSVFPLGIPRWKAFATVDWNLGSWRASWKMRYIGPMMETCSDYLDNTPNSLTNFGVCSEPNYQNNNLSMNRMAATVYNDAQVNYSYDPWNTTFTFGINNLFNKEPPQDVNSTLNSFDTSNYPIPGRFFYASVGVKF